MTVMPEVATKEPAEAESVPAETSVTPVKVLAPERTTVPAPVFETPLPLRPLMLPETIKVPLASALKVSEGAAVLDDELLIEPA